MKYATLMIDKAKNYEILRVETRVWLKPLNNQNGESREIHEQLLY